jgi:GntR family transcriptional regulator
MPPATPQQPKHVEVADKLRARINAGTYGGFAPIPSDVALASEFGVARSTVRQAIDTLRKEGLVHSVHRRGVFVRPPMPKRLIRADRYDEELAAALAGQRPNLDDPELPRAEVSAVEADADLAALFGVPAGTRLVRRDWVTRVGHVAAQMTTSHLPADLADMDAPLLRVGVGPITWLVSLGVVPTHVREVLGARMPTASERSTLETGDGWVIAVTRWVYAGERVVEVASEIVLPAQGTQFEHTITLGGG